MTFADFVSLPEVRYIGVPVAASAIGMLFSILSRPYGHKRTKRDDWKIGMSWNIGALIVWCTEVGAAQSRGMPAKGEWWTPLALVGLLAVSLYTVLEWGWVRDQNKKHKDPLEVETLAIISTIVFGGLSLMVLYTQLAG